MSTDWLDRAQYPFQAHYVEVDGGRMHYVDEGQGEPIVFVHGTPTWSFLYRHLIRELSQSHRCIALDHLGFGLSAKPEQWGYQVADHARNLATLIKHLGLQRFTLVVHDLGGPIGLSYALDHPEQIERLVLFNTFLWPFAVPAIGKLMGGPIGRLLYLRLNVSARSLLPMVYGDRSKLTPAIHSQYLGPFPRPANRLGMYAFAQQIAGGAPWAAALWARHERIANLPTLLIWGLKDPAFGASFLERWQATMHQAQTVTVPTAGHFVMEEAPEQALAALRPFLAPTLAR